VIETLNKEVRLFCDSNSKEPFIHWLEKLDNVTRRIIENRVSRLSLGNYGDHKRIDQDIFELRFHIGSGYRVYFAEDGDTIVILLLGGDKKTQKRDIEKAKEYYDKYKRQ
jgi:putative addiction module killer protein